MKSSKVMVLAGILSAAAGCSSTDDFVGSWKFSSGNLITTCDGQQPVTTAWTGNITINEGSGSDLVLVDDECSLKLSIDGDKASLDGSQTCITSGGGVTSTLTFSTFNFTTSDGENARLSSSASATVTGGGASSACTVSGSGDLEKL